MDLNLAKQKLAAAQNKGGQQREKIDYTKIFFKPKPGKYQVRILPNKYDKAWPIREVQFHYGFSKGPILHYQTGVKPIQLRISQKAFVNHLTKKIGN
jgi:hypothetical protein